MGGLDSWTMVWLDGEYGLPAIIGGSITLGIFCVA
jgi:hypothetical protein